MSRLFCTIGLVAFAVLGVAGCHSGGPGGGDQMPDPMDPMAPMHRVLPTKPACDSPSSAACLPAEAR